MKNSKVYILCFSILVVMVLGVLAYQVIKIDPYIHYHYPLEKEYQYSLYNQRYINDGITKNFQYDALITGTSMIENFKTTDVDSIFGVKSIKVPYSGGRYKEINDNIVNAIESNPKLKIVIRGLDYSYIGLDKDSQRTDLGVYPTYLYDDNVLNDVEYVFNRDVIFKRVYSMMRERYFNDFAPGITPFDYYSRWMEFYSFGVKTVLTDENRAQFLLGNSETLSEEDIITIRNNIIQNVTSTAMQNPNVDFYYFFTPYSVAWWDGVKDNNQIEKYIQCEKIAIEEILKHNNIKLFSFNNCMFITGDLNNYKDRTHYGEWIDKIILNYMHDDKCRITIDNYCDYLAEEKNNYLSYNYSEIGNQEDYADDYYADALIRQKYSGLMPKQLTLSNEDNCLQLSNDFDNLFSIEIAPIRTKIKELNVNTKDAVNTLEKYSIDNSQGYQYLVCNVTLDEVTEYAGISLYSDNQLLNSYDAEYCDDRDSTLLLIDISSFPDNFSVAFNGGFISENRTDFINTRFFNFSLY